MDISQNYKLAFNKSQIFDKKRMENAGRIIYKTNNFYKSLANIMEHPEFKLIFKEHFNSWENIEVFIMFSKLYEKIGDQFPDFSGYQKIFMIKELIETSNTRKAICTEVRKFRLQSSDLESKKNKRLN